MKLGKRLFLSFLAVIMVVIVSIGVGAPILIKDYLIDSRRDELSDKGLDLIRFIRDWQEDRITYWQFGRLINNLDHFLGARIWVLDEHNNLIMASEDTALDNSEKVIPSPLGPPPLPRQSGILLTPKESEQYREPRIPLTNIPGGSEIISVLEEGKQSEEIIRNHPYYKEDMLVVVIPFSPTRSNTGGTIVFHYPITSIDKILYSIYIYLGVAAALAIAVAMISASILSRYIVGPLLKMKTSAAAMAKGDYNLNIKPSGPEEVRELAQSFNSLAHDLDKTMKEITKQETLRRDFVANVSHELRTPLTIMRGFTEALLDDVITDPKQVHNTYQTMRDETVRLSGLITELLDLSRLQAPNVEIPLMPISLTEIIDNAAALFEQPCHNKGVNLEASIQEGPMDLIEGNGDRLTQLLLILLDNALKFTPPEGTIRMELKQDARHQTLTLSDTGHGISPDDLPFIWERFYKSDKSRQRNGVTQAGTGLGLAIAKEIIDKHCANVSVESTLGEGTSFIITFSRHIE